jgi:hypothetical protein
MEAMTPEPLQPGPDPVVEAYKRDVDRTLPRRNLRLTPTERLDNLRKLQDFAAELRRAARTLRRS